VSSAESIAPNPISSSVSNQSNHSITCGVSTNVPPCGGRGCNRPPPATRWNKPILLVDQVMTQIALPPYHGTHSPLDLVAIEIFFGCIFEAFRHIPLVVASTVVTDDDRPQKRLRQTPLRKVLVPR
jgi:hypothetical protein